MNPDKTPPLFGIPPPATRTYGCASCLYREAPSKCAPRCTWPARNIVPSWVPDWEHLPDDGGEDCDTWKAAN